MSRLPVPAAMPADLAERLSDNGVQEFSAEDQKEAREEIVDAILTKPKGWRGHKLFGVLQAYLNTEAAVYDVRLAEIAKHLQGASFGSVLTRLDASDFLRGTVEDYIEDEWVNERAAEIAAERLED